jgi:hypothetical protein
MSWDLVATLVILAGALIWAGWRLRRLRHGAGCDKGCASGSCRRGHKKLP